ncbi:hypothetical protein F4818DRAFT_457232 [Hypoxylon cercidicola]|nr:hypothetical protein F4818DRAFT_457232 [Hypoxylon cercidicola]
MESYRKEVSYDGKDICLDVSIDNEGWSTTSSFKITKFEGRRKNIPKPLRLDGSGTYFKEESILFRDAIWSVSQPAFDWGLGCFGNPTKLVETGKGETTELCWTDFHEIRTAEEFSRDRRGFKSDDEWIHLQRLYQMNAEDKTEQELINFHDAKQRVSQVDSHQAAFLDDRSRQEHYHVDRFLAELDDLESARPEEMNEAQNVTSAVVSTRGPPREFKDWIDEIDFMESNATMPQGTRYYQAR